jgi:hypothetical protein
LGETALPGLALITARCISVSRLAPADAAHVLESAGLLFLSFATLEYLNPPDWHSASKLMSRRIEIAAERKVGGTMMERKLTVAEIMLIAGTRVALGAGIGLLLSTRLNNDQRKAAGFALALVGGLTTIPLALGVIGKRATTTEIRPAA